MTVEIQRRDHQTMDLPARIKVWTDDFFGLNGFDPAFHPTPLSPSPAISPIT